MPTTDMYAFVYVRTLKQWLPPYLLMGDLCGPLVPDASLRHVHMHTGEAAKHAGHAAPARHPRFAALVCAAAGLQGVGGQDTRTWTAEHMSEASAALVTTHPGAVMGIMTGMSRQQRFGPRSTHSVSICKRRALRCASRQTQIPVLCCRIIVHALRSEGKPADMVGRFSAPHQRAPPHRERRAAAQQQREDSSAAIVVERTE